MPSYSSGKHAKAISDRSGMEFQYKEMVREWNGSFVHISEFEPKQPQLDPKPIGTEGVALRNIRPARTEPPVAIALPKDPFSITNGSPTLTVSLLNHNLKVGDEVLFFNGASNDPIQSFNLSTNVFPLFQVLGANLSATATTVTFDGNNLCANAGFFFIQSSTTPAADDPNYVPVIQREVIQYTGKSGGQNLTGLTRGTNAKFEGQSTPSTTATAHSSGVNVFPSLKIQTITTRTENTGAMPATKTVNTGFTVTLPYNAVGTITGGGENAFVSPMFRGIR